MSILEELNDDAIWDSFLQYKISNRHLSPKKEKELQAFIAEKKYKDITKHLSEKAFSFDYPEKICVNKSGSGKKRIVYSFGKSESMVLKVMAFLLYRYDDKISPCCYSFRRNSSAKEAIRNVLALPRLDEKYCLKADVSNYFNSIPPAGLIKVLEEIITDDSPLLSFLNCLLTADKAYENGQLITEKRGAMAGIPISPFFANVYLLSLDELFSSKGIPYFRYSDDILIFADSLTELEDCKALLQRHIKEKGLSLNPAKVSVSTPGEGWEFLGFCYRQGVVDLSDVTIRKMEDKIKRKAHSLYRWKQKKGADFDRTAKAMIRTFNKKFFDSADENAFTWSRWFFPVLTTDSGLRKLDACLVKYIRFLSSGRHYKGNYRVTYEQIKKLGFRSLVHEYYLFQKPPC